MSIDPQFSAYYTIALPLIVAFLAGLIRQDKLPTLANEFISYALVLIFSAIQMFLGGKLAGSPLADFILVAAYASTAIHTPPFAKLQQFLQSNVLSLGKPATAPLQGQPPIIDVPSLADALLQHIDLPTLAVLLKDELIKISQQPPQATPDMPTKPMPTAKTQPKAG